ncbi:hypothetical protein [Paraclostridium bifermentans]|uniref:hypothetical protein n=1 Tax=Paraclostridium bifermentans TaxID=1490 RepID=UPI0018A96D7A|nr:hypothetical protein [Paraclostridium bifermentans]
MLNKLKTNKYAQKLASEYINLLGILVVSLNLNGSKISNKLSLIVCIFLLVSLIICNDFKKVELFDSGFKLLITLVITSFITINSDLVTNNTTFFIFIFVLVPLFSLNINKNFDYKHSDKIIFIKIIFNVLILFVSSAITINEYLHKDFNLYVNLLNGIVIVTLCNSPIEMYRLFQYLSYKERIKLKIEKNLKIKKRKKGNKLKIKYK